MGATESKRCLVSLTSCATVGDSYEDCCPEWSIFVHHHVHMMASHVIHRVLVLRGVMLAMMHVHFVMLNVRILMHLVVVLCRRSRRPSSFDVLFTRDAIG